MELPSINHGSVIETFHYKSQAVSVQSRNEHLQPSGGSEGGCADENFL